MALPALLSNQPSAGFIQWTACSLQYDGITYNIGAGNSNKKFVWWKFNGGAPTLHDGDTLPPLEVEDLLLFLNKEGVGVLVPMTDVQDGSLIVSGSILADAVGANQINAYHIVADSITTEKIAAGAITAEEIAVGAVTTSALTVGSIGGNKVANGSFEDGTQGWTIFQTDAESYADVVAGVSNSGANALRMVRGPTSAVNLKLRQDKRFYIAVSPTKGTNWFVSCRAGATAIYANGFYLRVIFYAADKVTEVDWTDIVQSGAIGTTYATYEGQVTPPANAKYMAVEFINVLSNSTMYVDTVQAMEVTVSAQIANGAISANKILAKSITANEIKALTISGAEIEADAISASKIAANAVVAGKIAANAVTATTIAAGAITASKILAGSLNAFLITGANIQTSASANRGIEINSAGIIGYNSSGVAVISMSSSTGAVVMKDLTATNADITGAITATSGSFSGTINATSGTFSGSITSSATITGGTIRSASTGARVQLSGTALTFYSPGNYAAQIKAIDNGAAGAFVSIDGGNTDTKFGYYNNSGTILDVIAGNVQVTNLYASGPVRNSVDLKPQNQLTLYGDVLPSLPLFGTRPAIKKLMGIQAGVATVTTNSGGDASFNYPEAWTANVQTIQLTRSDQVVGATFFVLNSTQSLTKANFRVYNSAGAILPNYTLEVTYFVVGY